MPRRAPAALFAAVLIALSFLLSGTSPAAAAGLPGLPENAAARSTIEGVRLTWLAAAYAPDQPTPTAYRITRVLAGVTTVREVTNTKGLGGSTWDDTGLEPGDTATYTISALAGSVEGPATAELVGERRSWAGPFDPAQRSIVATWQHADDEHRGDDDLVALGAAATQTQSRFSAAGIDVIVRADLPDGTYDAVDAAGRIALDVTMGTWCRSDLGQAPEGTVTIRHAGSELDLDYRTLSLDAELTCAGRGRLFLQIRWDTPDPLTLLTAPTTTIESTSAAEETGTVTVTNSGSAPATVTDVALLTDGRRSAAGLSVKGTTCTTVAVGDTCTVTVGFLPTSGQVVESRAVLSVGTNRGGFESVVVGGLPQPWVRDLSAISSPGGVRVRWSPSASVPFDVVATHAVEELTAAGPVQLLAPAVGSFTQYPVPSAGAGPHSYRVVLRTTDGRTIPSPWVDVVVPDHWVLLATRTGYVSVNPQGWAAGGIFGHVGSSTLSIESVSASPSRSAVLSATSVSTFNNVLSLDTPTTSLGWWDSREIGDGAPSVAPDGVRAVVARPEATGGTLAQAGSLQLFGMSTHVLTAVPNSRYLHSPAWTPDGKAVLAAQYDEKGIVRIDPATGVRTPVAGTVGATDLAVSRTGRLVFTSYEGGWSRLKEVPLTGGTAKVLLADAGPVSPTWDPTGRYLLLTSGSYYGYPSLVYDLSPATPALVATLPNAEDGTWWDPVSSAPVPSAAVAAWTTAAPTVTVAATDPDDAPGGLRTECRLDTSSTWVPCAGVWKPGTLAAGTHTVTVRATDPAKVVGQTSASWKVDATAPTASLTALPAATLTTSIPLAWSGTDTGGSGLSRYDVRYRKASTGSGLGAYTYPSTLQATTAKATTLKVSAGYQYCLSVRARDVAGNVGAWGAERCTVVAMDDRSLSASKGWSRGSSTSYVYGTWTKATTSKVSLTRSGVSARRIGIIATTCSTCGSLDVWVGSTYAGRVSLVSSTWRTKQVKWLATFTSTRSGTLTLRTTSSRTTVVDGVLVSH